MSQPDIALGHFNHGGAVTNWHQHPGGQRLYVVAGTARVWQRRGRHGRNSAPGTLARRRPTNGHGAAPGNDAKILSFTWGATSAEELPGG